MPRSSQNPRHLHIVHDEFQVKLRSLDAERLRPGPASFTRDRWDGSPKRRREALAAELGCEDDYVPGEVAESQKKAVENPVDKSGDEL